MVFRPSSRLVVAAGAALAVMAGSLAATAVQAPHTSVVSDEPSMSLPYVADGAVTAFAQVGDTMVVGGTFTKVAPEPGGAAVARPYLFAFDTATGAMSSTFLPRLDKPVNALLPGPDGASVYVGGSFATVNGGTAKSLVLLDLADGSVDPGFGTRAMNGVVNTVKVAGGQLYVGGSFTKIGGRPRGGLATLHPTGGQVTDFLTSRVAVNHNWTPTSPVGYAKGAVGVTRLDITPTGDTMVAIGNFKQVDGAPHDQVAQWDLTGPTAAVKPWTTTRYEAPCLAKQYDSYVRDVDFSPDGSYFVIVTTGGHRIGELCDAAARWETRATPNDPTWVDYSGADSLLSTAITGEAVYVGGHQRWLNNGLGRDNSGLGGVPRPGIAALDPENGLPLSWNPGHNPRGVGTQALHATPQGLWMGSDKAFVGVHGANGLACTHPRCWKPGGMVFFPLAGGADAASKAVAGLPGQLHQGRSGGAVQARSFDGTQAGDPRPVSAGFDATALRGAMVVGSTLFYGRGDGNLYRRDVLSAGYGAEQLIDPYNDPDWSDIGTGSGNTYRGKKPNFYAEIPQVTSMVYDGVGTMYYTLSGQGALYSRGFTPDSGIVHHTRSVVPGVTLPNDVTGAVLADGVFFYTRGADGNLRRMAFSGGGAGPITVANGPGAGGTDWSGTTALWLQRPAGANEAPVARAVVSCTGLSCSADSSGSSDADGTIRSRSWTWGDGTPASTGVTASHAYDAAGTYTVTLTVTDDDGATSTDTQSVTVAAAAQDAPPTAAFTFTCNGGDCAFDGTGSSNDVTAWDWDFGTSGTATGSNPRKQLPEGTTAVTLTVTDAAQQTATTTRQVTVQAAPATSGGTRFGAVVKPMNGESYQQAVTRVEDKYGTLGVIREFDANAPDDWSVLGPMLTDHPSIPSFRLPPTEVLAGRHDAVLEKWFAEAPTGRPTWFTYLHEPEDNIARGEFTAADFRAAFSYIANKAEATGNADLRATLVLMCYTVNPRSGRQWRDYHVPEVETIGWDCYNHGKGDGGYGTPAQLLGNAVLATREAGAEFGVAELGSLLSTADSTGEGRAAWLTEVGRYLRANDAAFVSYFDTNGKGTDYRLLDDPSIAAWRQLVSGTTAP